MLKLSELEPGDEIQCWMKLGLALVPAIKGDTTPYYIVPPKPTTAINGALTRFTGWVVTNDPPLRVITIQVSAFNSWRQATSNQPRQADIAYSAFQRIRKFSLVSIQPDIPTPGTMAGKGFKRPGSLHPSTYPKPYRTVENVKLI